MNRRQDIWAKILRKCDVRLAGHVIDGKPDPCWIWTGGHSGNGRGGNYPRMCLDGGTVAVHRTSWTNQNGMIPPRKQIDHKCRNRMCVNPDHLEMVTHKENQKRRDAAKETI